MPNGRFSFVLCVSHRNHSAHNFVSDFVHASLAFCWKNIIQVCVHRAIRSIPPSISRQISDPPDSHGRREYETEAHNGNNQNHFLIVNVVIPCVSISIVPFGRLLQAFKTQVIYGTHKLKFGNFSEGKANNCRQRLLTRVQCLTRFENGRSCGRLRKLN